VIITDKDIVEARSIADPDKDKRLNADLSRIYNQEVRVIKPNKEGPASESYNIEVVLSEDGAEKLSKAIEKSLGKFIVILID
jgi:hypothetical protein